MRVICLGGDGFCGWPTALHLSASGHEVTVVDNFARRRADEELGAGSPGRRRPGSGSDSRVSMSPPTTSPSSGC